jgi:hypothetical protein
MMPKGSKYKAMAENYENIKLTKQQIERASDTSSKVQEGKMTVAEQQWAESFEELLYAEQRGKIHDAVDAFEKLTGRAPRQAEIAKINANIQTAITSNPTRASKDDIHNKKRGQNQGIRAPKSNMYDSSDYVRVMRGPVDQDDLGIEPAYSKDEVYDQAFKIEKETNPDNVAVMVNPEDGMIEAIDQARSKSRSLEKLIEDAKLSKEAKANLLSLAQKFSYKAMTYTMHGTQYMNLNYILVGADGQLYVQDQHDRIQTLALYLKRHTEDSFATHAEVYYPDGTKEIWIFQPGVRSNIEGKAVKYETV